MRRSGERYGSPPKPPGPGSDPDPLLRGRLMRLPGAFVARLPLGLLIAMVGAGSAPAQPVQEAGWARVFEDDRAIKVETDKLEAVIPKNHPKQWMTGIEKGSFLDKATGFREVG